jgi:hypothetical protein
MKITNSSYYKLDKLILASLVCLLASCTPKTIQPSSTHVPDLASTRNFTHQTLAPTSVTNTVKATQTKEPIHITSTRLPTPTMILTHTVPPDVDFDYKCIDIVDQPPEFGKYSGKIVLGGFTNQPSKLLDLHTMTEKLLMSGEGGSSVYESVSPDHEWLAFKAVKQNTLEITTTDQDNSSISFPWEVDWNYPLGWINNQYLLFYTGEGSILAFDPFTGTKKKLAINFPDQALAVNADYWGPVVFNPNLTLAIYPRNDNQVSLWDYQNAREVASIAIKNNFYGGIPVWAPDGAGFVMTLQNYDPQEDAITEELYWVTRDGDITKLTNLSLFYPKLLKIGGYAWSSDSNLISFWISFGLGNEFTDEQLVVLDLVTMQAMNLCVPGIMPAGLGMEAPKWSPDVQQFIIKSQLKGEIVVLLVDLEQGIAYKISDNFRYAGWLK